MRALLAPLWICLLLAPGAWGKSTNKPDLKLAASVDTSAPDQQPILVVHIVNQSGHALRMPEPPLLCKAAPGALSLDVKFVPENASQAQPTADCGLEVDGSGLPDIRERAKNWLVLKAGQDYEVRRPLGMGLEIAAHGSYELRVVYQGPSATPEDDQKLKDVGIAAPAGRFESDKLTYRMNMPKQ